MFRTKIIAVLLFAGFVGLCGARASDGTNLPALQTSPVKEAWQQEFDEVCSKTQDAGTLSTEELAALIRRCDALQPQLEKLDDTRKKVYLGRLKMCRNFYAYMLDSKKDEKK